MHAHLLYWDFANDWNIYSSNTSAPSGRWFSWQRWRLWPCASPGYWSWCCPSKDVVVIVIIIIDRNHFQDVLYYTLLQSVMISGWILMARPHLHAGFSFHQVAHYPSFHSWSHFSATLCSCACFGSCHRMYALGLTLEYSNTCHYTCFAGNSESSFHKLGWFGLEFDVHLPSGPVPASHQTSGSSRGLWNPVQTYGRGRFYPFWFLEFSIDFSFALILRFSRFLILLFARKGLQV